MSKPARSPFENCNRKDTSVTSQILVTDVSFLLQFSKGDLAGFDISHGTDFPEFLSQELVAGIAQHINQEGVYFRNLSGVGIEQEYAVLGRFKEATKTK